jgi:deoxycytidine triphosphate deaminase
MILNREQIEGRLRKGEIFTEDSWNEQTLDDSLKEASYVLRVAPDGLMLEGQIYRPDKRWVEGTIDINPGKIAILSTVERLNMPGDLVGKIGIRFDYACKGLTGLMGIQVDPFYGWGHPDERLYIRVANLGNEVISITPYAGVFTFELQELTEGIPEPLQRRDSMWLRIQELLVDQDDASWSNVTQVRVNVEGIQEELKSQEVRSGQKLESAREELRSYLQPLVMFGIFLVAVTILGVALSVILSVRDAPSVQAPDWVTSLGWGLLLVTLSAATLATAAMGVLMICRLWKRDGSNNDSSNTRTP